jgi:aspartyl/asparaginyl beta-hydroxylase (cupin superfamily)
MTSNTTDPEKLKKQLLDARKSLLEIFKESVMALNENQISQESFQSFRVVWQVAMEAVDRQDNLET